MYFAWFFALFSLTDDEINPDWLLATSKSCCSFNDDLLNGSDKTICEFRYNLPSLEISPVIRRTMHNVWCSIIQRGTSENSKSVWFLVPYDAYKLHGIYRSDAMKCEFRIVNGFFLISFSSLQFIAVTGLVLLLADVDADCRFLFLILVFAKFFIFAVYLVFSLAWN